jgi:hypothetical protein
MKYHGVSPSGIRADTFKETDRQTDMTRVIGAFLRLRESA